MDKAIRKADERHEYLSSDTDTQRLYEIREKAFLDWNSERNYALREGMEKGLKRGIAKGLERGHREGLREAARNLKNMGIPASVIAQSTGLTPEEIARL